MSGGLWRPVATCGRLLDGNRGPPGKIAAWRPGGLEHGGLEAWGETGSLDVAMMVRMEMSMLMHDDEDEH